MVTTRIDLREKVPVNIVRWAGLENTMNELFKNFEVWEQRNAELVNKFFNEWYFRWEESLINKLIEVKHDIKFDEIGDEWINLALLLYNNWLYDFKLCLEKVRNQKIKKFFINEIHDKLNSLIGWTGPYTDFDTSCPIPWNTNVLWYFEKVLDYLINKENSTGWKKVVDILKDITITNQDLNSRLPAWEQIPTGINLTDPSVPVSSRNDFDTLLSFEIWKEAARTVNIAENFVRDYQKLLTNSLPAINTIVWESDEYRYNEDKLWTEYQSKLQTIKDNASLDESEKNKQINNLKREYYIKYLKTKNVGIWNALEQLYNNDFDYSKLEPAVLKKYLGKVADIRLKKLFDNWMNEFIKLNRWNVDAFRHFYKNLADPSKKNIILNDVNVVLSNGTTTWGIIIPIQKKIVEGKNERLKEIDQFWKNADKSFDALPIEFTINKSDINNLDISIEDKTKLLNLLSKFDQWDKYVINWENVWNLIYLYFVINNNLRITEMDPEKQKEVEDLFWQAKNHKDKPKDENSDNNEWNESYTQENFKKDIEELWPWKFENWSEIWIPAWDSAIPGWGYQWMKIKISNINMRKWTFKWTVFWWELKFSSEYEWKSREFKMNQKTLENFKKTSKKISGSDDKVWLQPNPDKSDFGSFKDKLKGKLWTDSLSFPPEWVNWDDGKFTQTVIDEDWNEKKAEVKYFWASSDDKSTYRVEYNPIRHNFTVSSTFNWDEKWKDWKSEKKRFSYERDMDWNNFLIFFNQKWLVPQTEEQAKDAVIRQDNEFKMVNGGKWKLHWFSINNIRHWFKDIIWALNKKIDDYNKKQDEQFRGLVEGPILNALGSLPFLPPSIKSAIWERQQELYNEEFNGAWTEIEKYLKALQSDGQFADTFDQVPPHVQTLYWKSYKDFIKNLYAKKSTSTGEKRKAAALLLANFEKWWSPFRGLSEFENQWLWVKVLLWEDHYRQFLRDKAACIRDRDLAEKSKESWLDKKGLNEQLATCEMDYIINNVRWAYPKLPWSYFPSHENRWINWDKSTNYIPNPSKRLLSEQFANKLEDAKKWWFTKSSVEEAYWKNKSVNKFEVMEDDFGKMWSSRYKQGAWALRRMFDLAADESLRKRAKRHFLTYLLSWALDVNCDPWLKKQVYGWAKPMSFVPWMLVKEAWVAENIAILLDDIEPKWDFSKNVTKYFHRNGQLKWWIDFKWLQDEIKKRLTDEKMDKLDDYFSKLPTKDFSGYPEPQKSILNKFKKALIEEDVEEFDRWLLDNPKIVNNGLLTNINVVSDRLRIEDWEFRWKDSDDISNKKAFWDNIKSSISKLDAGDSKTVDFVLNKYFTWFWLNSAQERQNVYKRINTAYHYQQEVLQHGWIYSPGHKKKIKDRNWRLVDEKIPVWRIDNNDIDKILLYGLEWNVRSRPPLSWKILPKELKDALDAFQQFFESAFRARTLNHSDVKNGAFKLNVWDSRENDRFLLWWWDVYQKIARKDDYTSVLESDEAEYNGKFTDLKESEQKKIWRSILRDDDLYINPHMENIEKTLKRNRNVLDWNWRLTTTSDSDQLLNLQEALGE